MDAETAENMADDLRIALAGENTPAWFSATVLHDGREWDHVGLRYRGNGTIEDLKDAGSSKYPLRLNFDKWEDDFPELKNQRFYGFKKLNLLSSAKDESMVRSVLAGELYHSAGVKAPRASFVRLYLDDGEGAVYQGVYTLMEDLEDPATQEAQLGGGDGALYEPTEEGGALLSSSTSQLEAKNEEANFTDAESFLLGLEDGDLSALAGAFDVDGFLRLLALNRTMGDHQSYGCKGQNYFLYASAEEDGRLTMVPWDWDRHFTDNVGRCGDGVEGEAEFLADAQDSNWPLIELLLSDPAYNEAYLEHLRDLSVGILSSERTISRARELHALLEPYVLGEETELEGDAADEFLDAIDGEGGLADALTAREAVLTSTLSQEL